MFPVWSQVWSRGRGRERRREKVVEVKVELRGSAASVSQASPVEMNARSAPARAALDMARLTYYCTCLQTPTTRGIPTSLHRV